MYEQKTKARTGDVAAFIAQIDDAKRADSETLMAMMEAVSGEPAVLWGSMVGFGRYHYRYASGTEGETFLIGFAARRTEFTIYLMGIYFPDSKARAESLLARLGKHRMGKACLYVKRLADIDLGVLAELIELSVTRLKQEYGQIDAAAS